MNRSTGEPLAATIYPPYLEVDAAVPMMIDDNLVKAVIRANG
jgi:hypothetical protein